MIHVPNRDSKSGVSRDFIRLVPGKALAMDAAFCGADEEMTEFSRSEEGFHGQCKRVRR